MLSKTSRVISSKARNLAECPGRVPARDPSALRFVGMTTDAKMLYNRETADVLPNCKSKASPSCQP